MGRDPAFLFYDGDAARDVSHMTRLERGCYFDLIQAQRKFGGYTMEQARKILGKDFVECWSALELVLKMVDGVYSIEWLTESIAKRVEHSNKQKDRITKYWNKVRSEKAVSVDTAVIPRNNHGYTLENEIENEIENEVKKDRVVRERKIFIPPTIDEVIQYCKENNLSVDPHVFVNKGQGNGWVDKNGNKYKDWKAVLRTWNSYSTIKTQQKRPPENTIAIQLAKYDKK